ncbi:MAG: ATP-binding cassette domain-containing protein [Bacteroidota bacterium]
MIQVKGLSVSYEKKRVLTNIFLEVEAGNIYGVVGPNGAGKSTFLKILSGEIDPRAGSSSMGPDERMAVLKQNHFEFDEETVLDTVLMGHSTLWNVMKEKNAIYEKPDFSEEDGVRASELEAEFAEMNGWEAEADAAALLSGVNIPEDMHYRKMGELTGQEKVRVLLAQALFGNPDLLLLDEPTNDLDVETILWLEDFLADFRNTVIVVSHDRHFLDAVCTHVVDIDRSRVQLHSGNYTFWYESSQLAARQLADRNKKNEEKRKELQSFIERFSANAAKSKQATSRKKLLDKLKIEDIKPSSRRYPGIIFEQERDAGDQILNVENLSKSHEGELLFSDISFSLKRGDKVAVISKSSLAITTFFRVLAGELEADTGSFDWGVTINMGYLPNDNTEYFEGVKLSLVDWLRQFSEEKDETFVRGFLGRMLFSGEESLKEAHVLSGGEKVRCMLSKLMLQKPNFLILDEPTNHLDLESITAFNNSLKTYGGSLMMTSHDHEFMQTVSNRIIEITPNGKIDRYMEYDEYIVDPQIKELRKEMYGQVVK